MGETYGFVGLGGFAQVCGDAVDFFDHACEVLAHVI